MINSELVFIGENGVPFTNTKIVAEVFGKHHKDVLRSVRRMITQAGFDVDTVIGCDDSTAQIYANLVVREEKYVDVQGRERHMYLLNRDAFTLLAMGFEGAKAVQFKMQYISAFNKMAEYIEKEKSTAVVPMSAAEMLLQSAQLMVEHEKRMTAIEDKTRQIEDIAIRIEEKEKELEEKTRMLLESEKSITQKVEAIEKDREENGERLLALELSEASAPEETMRSKIVRAVNTYCSANGVKQQDMWHRIYKDLYYLDHIRIDKEEGKSKLDVCERRGLLTYVWNRVSEIIRKR